MTPTRRAASLALLLLPAAPLAAQTSPRDSAWHALNRLAFGPTPGLVDSVANAGVHRWIAAQLAATHDDAALRARLEPFEVLHTSQHDLLALYRSAQEARRRMLAAQGGEAPPAPAPGEMMDEARARRELPPDGLRLRRLGGEFQQVTVLRAATAEHQLREVMVDFWTNHFNVFAGKAIDRVLFPAYIEQVIRPRAMGRFADLLLATAKSPAMLVYLDNAQSIMPGSAPPGPFVRRAFERRRAEGKAPTGINENYARELLELHTLGVDGGYTQRDVQEVARILTGWSIDKPQEEATYIYRDWAHDKGAKRVLGIDFPAGQGEEEGERLLRLLAMHPATMKHVSAQLCQRFVADVPPDGCIDDAVAAWKQSGGEIREVLRAIVEGPDFWAPSARGTKFKSPFEFLVSAVRAVQAAPDSTLRLAQVVARLGQPLFLQPSPAGYPERSDEWVNSGALLGRMNVGMGLAANKLPGAVSSLDAIIPAGLGGDALLDAIDRQLLGGTMAPRTRDAMRKELAGITDPTAQRIFAVGLALGGPDFQRQ